MRLPSESAKAYGIASVSTVAAAATAANTIVIVWVLSELIRKSSIGSCYLERVRLRSRS